MIKVCKVVSFVYIYSLNDKVMKVKEKKKSVRVEFTEQEKTTLIKSAKKVSRSLKSYIQLKALDKLNNDYPTKIK